MRVRSIGYFYQNSESRDLDFQDTLFVPSHVPLPTSATIYKINHPDNLGDIDLFAQIWAFEDCYVGLHEFHYTCQNMEKCDKCPWRAPTGVKGFEAEEEKDRPCSFFYMCEDEKINETRPCPYLASCFPLYIFPAELPITNIKDTKMYWYVVHPDENERMERILNGTDNPLYDLVHELRYNPAIPSVLSTERKEAQDRFEENAGQKRARIDKEET